MISLAMSSFHEQRYQPSQRDEDTISLKSSSLSTSPLTVFSSSNDEKPLPQDFKISNNTVIIGRGRFPRENKGNIRLREIAKQYLQQYSKATEKKTKSEIVLRVISTIHESEDGMFVRFRRASGNPQWYQVDNSVAREKVGYIFRDLLADRYRSSSKSKVAKRLKEVFTRSDFSTKPSNSVLSEQRSFSLWQNPSPLKRSASSSLNLPVDFYTVQSQMRLEAKNVQNTTASQILERHNPLIGKQDVKEEAYRRILEVGQHFRERTNGQHFRSLMNKEHDKYEDLGLRMKQLNPSQGNDETALANRMAIATEMIKLNSNLKKMEGYDGRKSDEYLLDLFTKTNNQLLSSFHRCQCKSSPSICLVCKGHKNY